ncbi:MAG: hypothetical protein ACHQ2Z_16515 [Elusimicrobiota bacterium]
MKYWAYMNGEVPGSYAAEELAALPGFSMTTLICPASGEISEKNWRRAGEFGDVAAALAAREDETPPPPPAATTTAAAAAATSASADVDALIDTASTKLFSHVADLMKELENRREEKGLITSLQRHIAALKDELTQTRERSHLLEMRLPRLTELEEIHRKNQAEIESLQSSLLAREQSLNEARIAAEKNKNEFDAAKRRLQETVSDLSVRNRLVDKLSKELSEKELSLVKSLGVIRRLEEDLNRLCPPPAAEKAGASSPASGEHPIEREAPPASPPATLPSASYTLDEPPSSPPYLEPAPPGDRPKAQEALMNFLKRILPDQPH